MNKILVIVYVPLIEKKYELYIPINKKIGTIKNLVMQSINEMSNGALNESQNLRLYNNDTGDVLPNNMYIRDSKMMNGTTLVLI